MPQFDPSTYPTQLFWLALTFLVLYLMIWKVVLPRITDVRATRQRKIEDDLEKASELREEAEVARAQLEQTHAEAADDAQAIHREAAGVIAENRATRQAEVSERLIEETRAAEARIVDEKNQAIATVPDVAAEVIQAAVERLIGAEAAPEEIEAAIASVGREPSG